MATNDIRHFCTKCNPFTPRSGYGTVNTTIEIDQSSKLFRIGNDTVCRNCLYIHTMSCMRCTQMVPLSKIRHLFENKWACVDCLCTWLDTTEDNDICTTIKCNHYKRLYKTWIQHEKDIQQYKELLANCKKQLVNQTLANQNLNKQLIDATQSLKKQIDEHITTKNSAISQLDVCTKERNQLGTELSQCKKLLDEQVSISHNLNKLLIEYITANNTTPNPILNEETKQKLQMLAQMCSASVTNIIDLIDK